MAAEFDVVVIGAGIVGSSTACHLKRRGVEKVCLVERGARPACGTTGASAAIVRQHYSNAELVRLTGESIEIFRELESRGQEALYRQNGYYFLLPEGALESAARNIEMHRSIGVDTSLLSPQEFRNTLPWLKSEGVAGVVFEPGGGYAEPVKTTEALVRWFVDLGGTVQFNVECKSLVRKGSRVVGVDTDGGFLKADKTVNACGPWAAALARTADIDLPLKIYREQETIWRCEYAADMPTGSISNAVESIYVRPSEHGCFTVGRGFPKDYFEADPWRYEKGADDAFIEDVLSRAERRFVPFARAKARFVKGFSSLYDVSPDWYPIVGARRDVEGYYDASGGSGHGFKLAPAIGRHLANWIAGGDPSDAIASLSYDRIPDENLFVQKYGGNRG